MRRGVAIAGNLACALWLAAVDVPLKYERYGDDDGSPAFRPRAYALLEKSAKAPAGDWKLPELKSSLPVYACADIGGGKRLLILDKQDAKDPFYNRLYLDANGNNDLRDDPVIETPRTPEGAGAAAQRDFHVVQFPPAELTLDCGAYKTPFSVRAVSYFRGAMPGGGLTAKEIESEAFYFYLVLNCCYRGECELGGVKHRLVLADLDVNGLLEPRVVMATMRGETSPRGDCLYMTAGDGLTYRDASYLGTVLVVRSVMYDVRLDLSRNVMRVEPSKGAGVATTFPFELERLSLAAEDGVHNVMLIKPGTQAVVPAGKYRPCRYGALKKDAEGDLWRLEARATGDTPCLEFAGGAVKAAFGEPFTVKAVVPEAYYARRAKSPAPDAKLLPLSMQILGAAHEIVTSLERIEGSNTKIALEKDGQRPKEPTYSIASVDGKVLATGSFQYG